jgi:hypothetical protein
MTDLNAIREARLAQYSAPRALGDSVVAHIAHCIKHFQTTAILLRLAEQNVSIVRGKIIEFVAQLEKWEHVDPNSYSSFEVACSTLFLKYNIFIRQDQKEMSSPDYAFTDPDISGFNKFYYDLELNATDPYFDVIKRDYYNDVSS